MPAAELYLGLISGTSADAIDAALVDFGHALPQCVAASASPYAPGLRQRILDLALAREAASFDTVGAIDVE